MKQVTRRSALAIGATVATTTAFLGWRLPAAGRWLPAARWWLPAAARWWLPAAARWRLAIAADRAASEARCSSAAGCFVFGRPFISTDQAEAGSM